MTVYSDLAKKPFSTEPVLLFEYAELKDPKKPSDCFAYGELRRRGKDAAARFSDIDNLVDGDTVQGQLKEVTLAELHRLDVQERPEYDRVRVTVFRPDGTRVRAWAYEDVQADFEELPVVTSGNYEVRT